MRPIACVCFAYDDVVSAVILQGIATAGQPGQWQPSMDAFIFVTIE